MAGIDQLDVAAIATLVLPLQPRRRPDDTTELRWHRWDESYGEPCGLGEKSSAAHEARPYKRYPVGDWSYFNPHVERLLFPGADTDGEGAGERWISCPDDFRLGVGWDRKPELVARVDLVERLTVPGPTSCDFGLLHLTFELGSEAYEDDVLWWAWMIRAPFRFSEGRPRFILHHGGEETELKGRRPISELARLTLGEPHPQLDRHLYSAVMATYPEKLSDARGRADWRRALAVRSEVLPSDLGEEANGDEERDQTIHLGRFTALVRENRVALTQERELTKADARNFRSYWTESLLVGLVQHDALEHFQTQLAGLGTPIQPEVIPLYEGWLGFRNRIWWSQLSTSTRVPQEFLSRLRAARGTDRLFADLEGDLATYSAQQRTIADGRQARALANLQVFGAAFVVISALLELIGLSGAHGELLVFLIALATGLAVGAAWAVNARLELDTARSSPGA